MRSISAGGLQKLKTRCGVEPIIIVEADWRDGTTLSYADADVGTIPGKILEVGDLDSVINVSGSGSTSSLSIKLSDIDGSLKEIFDAHDVHKRPARVYQYFRGLDLSDKFLIFSGVVSTPIEWNDRERTFSFSILSPLENLETGFSAEEGNFSYLPASMVGKPWPMVFGTAIDYKTLPIDLCVKGTTLTGVGVLANTAEYLNSPSVDFLEQEKALFIAREKRDFIKETLSTFDCVWGYTWDEGSSLYQIAPKPWVKFTVKNYSGDAANLTDTAEEDSLRESEILQIIAEYASVCAEIEEKERGLDCAKRKLAEARQAKVDEAAASCCGRNPLLVLGGEDFPQDEFVTVRVGHAVLYGKFLGQEFTITSRALADEITVVTTADASVKKLECDGAPEPERFCFRYQAGSLAPKSANSSYGDRNLDFHTYSAFNEPLYDYFWKYDYYYHYSHAFTPTYDDLGAIDEDGPVYRTFAGVLTPGTVKNSESDGTQILQSCWEEPGTPVRLASDVKQYYVASITPGTVLSVKGFRKIGGVSKLVELPTSWYSIETRDYGVFTATLVVLNKPLSWREYRAEGLLETWTDEVYVTFKSSVGPNIADIIQYLVSQYSSLSCDAASFAHVKARTENFPANFVVFARKNIVTFLQELAEQARLAVWIDSGVVRLKYLPEEPASVDDIKLDDVLIEKGVEVSLTPTEDLITKMVIDWRSAYTATYSSLEDAVTHKMILRHNVVKYGVKEQSYDYYVYNQPEIIYKVATFWLMRKSITWKRVKFSTPLHKLNIETFDAVTLDFGYVAGGAVKAVVESARYNSNDCCIDFECVVPVAAGEMSQYAWYWPADLPATKTWPPQADIDADKVRSGARAVGDLPVGSTKINFAGAIFVGGPNIIYGPNSDRGDASLTDSGFSAKEAASQSGLISTEERPTPDLKNDLYKGPEPIDWSQKSGFGGSGSLVIDIAKTTIVDTSGGAKKSAKLSTLLAGVKDDKLVFSTLALFGSPADGEVYSAAPFSFRYDTDEKVYGTDFVYWG